MIRGWWRAVCRGAVEARCGAVDVARQTRWAWRVRSRRARWLVVGVWLVTACTLAWMLTIPDGGMPFALALWVVALAMLTGGQGWQVWQATGGMVRHRRWFTFRCPHAECGAAFDRVLPADATAVGRRHMAEVHREEM